MSETLNLGNGIQIKFDIELPAIKATQLSLHRSNEIAELVAKAAQEAIDEVLSPESISGMVKHYVSIKLRNGIEADVQRVVSKAITELNSYGLEERMAREAAEEIFEPIKKATVVELRRQINIKHKK